jgi:hypothetical protein
MEGSNIGVYGIAIMFAVLFLLRIPAGFTMALVGFAGIAYVTSIPAACGMIGSEIWSIFSNYGLTVIPMFILVGEFIHYAGYNDSLYHATHRWFGHYRGGLAITTIMASAAFSAISGSNTATAATMSTVAIPAMKCDPGRLDTAEHRPRSLWVIHRPVHREALFRQRDPQHYSDFADRRHGFSNLPPSYQLGTQG